MRAERTDIQWCCSQNFALHAFYNYVRPIWRGYAFVSVCLSVCSICLSVSRITIELRMFYQTYTTRRPPKWPPPGSDGMIPSAAAGRYLQRAHYHTSCNRTDHSVDAWVMGVHSMFLSLVTLTFDLWPNTFELHVSLTQIRSALRQIFDSHTKKNKKVADNAKNRTFYTQFTACGEKVAGRLLWNLENKL